MTAPTDTPVPSIPGHSPAPDVEVPAAESAPAPGGNPGEQAPGIPPSPEPAAGAANTAADEDDKVDLDAILPDGEKLTVGDIPCKVRRIKLRELMLLAQVVSSGLGSNLTRVDWSTMTDDKMFALALVALPEAGPEIESFFRAVVEPRDSARANELQPHLTNPAIEDFLSVAGVLIVQEREEFARLGKHLQQMVKGLQALWRTGKRGT